MDNTPPTNDLAGAGSGPDKNPQLATRSIWTDATRQDSIQWSARTRTAEDDPTVRFEDSPVYLRRSRTSFFRLTKGIGWHLEIASAVISLLCLVAMIVILKLIDGKLLIWWGLAVSPNAIISTLSTAAKAAMALPVSESISQLKWLQLLSHRRRLRNLQVFDDASRGPWGSTTFFFSAALKTAPLMTSLGCLITIVAIAFDPFAQQILQFTSGPALAAVNASVPCSTIYDNQLKAKGAGSKSLSIGPDRDLPMRAAIIGALYDKPLPVPFECPGSNCTYPAFESVGICSSCADVTATTSQQCRQQNYVQKCNVTTPGNFSYTAGAFSDDQWGFIHQLVLSQIRPTQAASNANFANLSMIRYPFEDSLASGPNETRWRDTLQAYECSLNICGLSYSNFTVTNGTVNPGKVEETPLRFGGSAEYLFHYLSDPEDGRPQKNYTVNLYDTTAFLKVLLEIFNGTARGETDSWDVALFQSPDYPATIANIASSMSHRMLAGPNATTVLGQVYKTEVYIHVQWLWLVLPTALVVLSCLLLASVVIATRSAQLIPWKSSLTPLLYLTESDPRLDPLDEKAAWSPGEQDARAKIIMSHLQRDW